MRPLLVLLFVMAHHGVLAQPCQPLGWDAAFTRDLNALNSPAVIRSSQIVSSTLLPATLGTPMALFLGAHALTFNDCSTAPRMAKAGIQIGTTMATAYAITLGLKYAIDRDRPYQTYPDCIRNGASDTDPSFPSGHSAGSAALATSLSLAYPEWYVIAPSVGYALWTGFSRMNLGVHYITDVVAGYAVGVGAALLVHALRDELFSITEPLIPTDNCTRTGSIMVVPSTNLVSVAISF
jgi:membrane-associated phospholipid phosphatase